MKNIYVHWLASSALLTFWLCMPASAQSVPGQSNATTRSSDTTNQELAHFDQFLDSHREIAEQIRKDPSLVNNQQFLKNHPALQSYLQSHPEIQEELKENPIAFMQQESRYDRRENNPNRDTTHIELSRFDQFLDSHREIAEQVRKDPSLVNNAQFVKNHPALQTYLQQHPDVREEIKENPNAFMQAEARYDQHEQTFNHDASHLQLSHFDQFLDSHREIAEQLRKDPSLVNNQQFLKDHPALQAYLQNNPEVRQGLTQNPSAYMQREAGYDQRENRVMDRDNNRGQFASFGAFLGAHSSIAQQISKDPSLVKNQEYLESHPELQSYLNAHPQVRQELMETPQSFVKSSQQFTTTGGQAAKSMPADPKSKQ